MAVLRLLHTLCTRSARTLHTRECQWPRRLRSIKARPGSVCLPEPGSEYTDAPSIQMHLKEGDKERDKRSDKE